MKQQSIDPRDELQPVTEETFFEEETVQRIPAVIPLNETPTKTSARFQKMRVPMRKADNSFNPAFLIMALLAVTALGVIAGTMVYRTSAERTAANDSATETDDPVNRTIPAQYQVVVGNPGESSSTSSLPTGAESRDNLSGDNFSSLSPSTSDPARKDSRNRQQEEESPAPDGENEQPEQNAQKEENAEENQSVAPPREGEEELPPPLPLRRDRKEDKKQDKPKPKSNNAQPENRQENEQSAADSESEN